jgi:protein-disulfide isomerase
MSEGKGRLLMTGLLSAIIGAGGAALAMGATAQPVNTADKAAIERIVRDYILANPEVLTQAMDNLQNREMKKLVDDNRAELEKPFGGAWEGSADADVTLVQFFDYACTYCRASLPDIDRLLAEDKKLTIVYRELPILGQPSLDAARASLAVAQQGNYGVFHRALYAGGRITPASLEAARKRAGVDTARARAAEGSDAVNREIAANLEIQSVLQITGTPSWVVGDRILNGAVGYETLKQAIADARKARTAG